MAFSKKQEFDFQQPALPTGWLSKSKSLENLSATTVEAPSVERTGSLKRPYPLFSSNDSHMEQLIKAVKDNSELLKAIAKESSGIRTDYIHY